jgi:methionyl-tRNA formyltransferase
MKKITALKSSSLGAIDGVIVFGGSWLTAAFLRMLSKTELKITLYTSPRHFDEVVESDNSTLKCVTKSLSIKTIVTEDVNNEKSLSELITKQTLGISLGAAWVFEPETVKLFNGKLLDFMGIALPKYRGGAHYTWQILANNKSGACNLQIIYGGKESFHKGEIIKRSEYLFPESARIPQDYFNFAIRKETLFLAEFLNEVHEEKNFSLVSLDESISSYYPFLNTKIQGWINWNWSAEEIDRFICAFDDPYDGASTFINGNRVFLKKCRYVKSNVNFHPFHSGLIYRCSHDSLFISARGGALVLQQVINDNGQNIIQSVQEGQRLTTPANKLESALSCDAKYGPNGLI